MTRAGPGVAEINVYAFNRIPLVHHEHQPFDVEGGQGHIVNGRTVKGGFYFSFAGASTTSFRSMPK